VEGLLRQEVYRDGKFHDLLRVAVLKEDFEKHPLFSQYAPRTLLDETIPQIAIQDEHRIQF